MKTCFVYVTARDEAEARDIARTVVKERLAACANMPGGIESFYWWDGRLCEDREAALVLKTTETVRAELVRRIKELHSYEIPCIVCLPIDDGNPEFLDWIRSETSRGQSAC
jgi:periplasmic divalent cation tolerance protein